MREHAARLRVLLPACGFYYDSNLLKCVGECNCPRGRGKAARRQAKPPDSRPVPTTRAFPPPQTWTSVWTSLIAGTECVRTRAVVTAAPALPGRVQPGAAPMSGAQKRWVRPGQPPGETGGRLAGQAVTSTPIHPLAARRRGRVPRPHSLPPWPLHQPARLLPLRVPPAPGYLRLLRPRLPAPREPGG